MTHNEREMIRTDMIENVYKKSWTYERLSKIEKTNVIEMLQSCRLFGINKRQICETLNDIYTSFLAALRYEPIGWRGD